MERLTCDEVVTAHKDYEKMKWCSNRSEKATKSKQFSTILLLLDRQTNKQTKIATKMEEEEKTPMKREKKSDESINSDAFNCSAPQAHSCS